MKARTQKADKTVKSTGEKIVDVANIKPNDDGSGQSDIKTFREMIKEIADSQPKTKKDKKKVETAKKLQEKEKFTNADIADILAVIDSKGGDEKYDGTNFRKSSKSLEDAKEKLKKQKIDVKSGEEDKLIEQLEKKDEEETKDRLTTFEPKSKAGAFAKGIIKEKGRDSLKETFQDKDADVKKNMEYLKEVAEEVKKNEGNSYSEELVALSKDLLESIEKSSSENVKELEDKKTNMENEIKRIKEDLKKEEDTEVTTLKEKQQSLNIEPQSTKKRKESLEATEGLTTKQVEDKLEWEKLNLETNPDKTQKDNDKKSEIGQRIKQLKTRLQVDYEKKIKKRTDDDKDTKKYRTDSKEDLKKEETRLKDEIKKLKEELKVRQAEKVELTGSEEKKIKDVVKPTENEQKITALSSYRRAREKFEQTVAKDPAGVMQSLKQERTEGMSSLISSQQELGAYKGSNISPQNVLGNAMENFGKHMLKLRMVQRGIEDIGKAIAYLQSIEDTSFELGIVSQMGVERIRDMRKELLLTATNYKQSSEEIGKAQLGIVKTGMSLKDSMEIVSAALNLSKATYSDLAYASDSINKVLLPLEMVGSSAENVAKWIYNISITTPASLASIDQSLRQTSAVFGTFLEDVNMSGVALDNYKESLAQTQLTMIGLIHMQGKSGSVAHYKSL